MKEVLQAYLEFEYFGESSYYLIELIENKLMRNLTIEERELLKRLHKVVNGN